MTSRSISTFVFFWTICWRPGKKFRKHSFICPHLLAVEEAFVKNEHLWGLFGVKNRTGWVRCAASCCSERRCMRMPGPPHFYFIVWGTPKKILSSEGISQSNSNNKKKQQKWSSQSNSVMSSVTIKTVTCLLCNRRWQLCCWIMPPSGGWISFWRRRRMAICSAKSKNHFPCDHHIRPDKMVQMLEVPHHDLICNLHMESETQRPSSKNFNFIFKLVNWDSWKVYTL